MGGSFLFCDEQNRRVEAHSRDSMFFLFRYRYRYWEFRIRHPHKVNCDVWIILFSREFHDVLLCSIHLFTYLIFCLGKTILLDTLENLILLHGCGESWMRIVRDLHREKTNTTHNRRDDDDGKLSVWKLRWKTRADCSWLLLRFTMNDFVVWVWL